MSLCSTPFLLLAALAGFVVFCTALSEESLEPWNRPSLESERELQAELMALEAEISLEAEQSLEAELSIEADQSLDADQSLESEYSVESNQTLVQKYLDSLYTGDLSDIEDLSVEPRGLIRFFKQLRKCVRKVNVWNLMKAQKKILLSCILPAFRGQPLTPLHIVLRYAKCVFLKNLDGPVREAVQQVAQCMKDRKV